MSLLGKPERYGHSILRETDSVIIPTSGRSVASDTTFSQPVSSFKFPPTCVPIMSELNRVPKYFSGSSYVKQSTAFNKNLRYALLLEGVGQSLQSLRITFCNGTTILCLQISCTIPDKVQRNFLRVQSDVNALQWQDPLRDRTNAALPDRPNYGIIGEVTVLLEVFELAKRRICGP